MVSGSLTKFRLAACSSALLLFSSARAGAQTPPPIEATLHHAPVSVATAGEPLTIVASIDHPELVSRAFVVYRTEGDRADKQVAFLRASYGPYIAIIPQEAVKTPFLGYTVELEPVQGGRRAVFASRSEMQQVEVPGDLEDSRERAMLERLGGRRSVLAASGEYVMFSRSDRYWRTEAGYTFRPLRRIAEFGIRAGVVRGPNAVPDPTKPDVGLNYGAPSIRVRLADAWHLEGEFLTSITEVGFSVGAGGALLIGDPYGSKLVLGFESIQIFGTRMYSRLDIAARRALLISPIVEVTNMPHAVGGKFGVRLLTEARFDLGQGFTLGILGGYQARVAASGGPTAGLSAAYAF
ncbi:MAG TPA: hypothetical protein VF881_17305 [Polyangiaceae bacterium]